MAESDVLTIDQTRKLSLYRFATLDQYNRWLYEQFEHVLGRSIIEIGAGVGNITQCLSENDREVLATEITPYELKLLKEKFAHNPNIRVEQFDLTSDPPTKNPIDPVDTVVCLNVIEHIDDDIFALELMRSVLKNSGTLVLLVPAHRVLYGEFDRAVGHYRRYEKDELIGKLNQAGFKIQSIKFFSFLATLPWFINFRLLKRDHLSAFQISWADRLVPFLKLEKFIGPPAGLSLIAVARPALFDDARSQSGASEPFSSAQTPINHFKEFFRRSIVRFARWAGWLYFIDERVVDKYVRSKKERSE
jgi:SAM-dependent methyltransferase